MFFGEPALRIEDWIQLSEDGRGYVNILHCEKLFGPPLLYSTFLLWMLSELFETLPEVGDMEKPKIIFSSTRRIWFSATRPRRSSRRSSRS